MNHFKNVEKKDRYLGCFLGGAVGDALGYPVEFYSESRIWKEYGPCGIRDLEQGGNPAVITDDTQMTLFNINGLLYAWTNGIPESAGVWLGHREWLGTQEDTFRMDDPRNPKMWIYEDDRLHDLRAPGFTCLRSVRTSKDGGTLEDPVNNSKGCGAIMKASPFGLCGKYDPSASGEDYMNGVFQKALPLNAQTHGHPLAWYSATYLSLILAEIVQHRPGQHETLQDAILSIRMNEDPAAAEVRKGVKKAVKLALDKNVTDLDGIHALGEGWVSEEALYIPVFCAVRYQDDFAAAIRCAVNHKGDADSTGAICGNILGAWMGKDAVAKAFNLKYLEMADLIEELATDFYQAVEHGVPQGDARWNAKYLRK